VDKIKAKSDETRKGATGKTHIASKSLKANQRTESGSRASKGKDFNGRNQKTNAVVKTTNKNRKACDHDLGKRLMNLPERSI